ncbi:hypothetical protein CALCODRAFT_532642 [Calocera cornea HHB12733]|uniref:Uncharacterized protein n=1 Tax=Calocera cornea HHB12733 TaxID=1353952 RepID=A0A165IDV0_9BASI|nr:hypothetical protein CALCODRAFT_532642 [Calocera cornea HHB12733]
MSILLLRAMARSTGSAEGIFAPSIKPWIIAVLAITLFQNSLVTLLLVWRIHRINSIVSGFRSQPLEPLIAMLLESGLIYVAVLFIWLMTYVSNSNSEYVLVDCINPTIGITYSALVIRVRISEQQTSTKITGATQRVSEIQSHRLQEISIEVHRQAHRDPSLDRESVSDFGTSGVEERKKAPVYEHSPV